MEVDDRCPVAGDRIVMDGLAAIANFAPIQRIQPGQRPQEQRFPRSRRAGQHEARPGSIARLTSSNSHALAIRVTAANMIGFQEHVLPVA